MNNIESDYIKTFAYILIILGIIILGCYIYTMYISEYTILERLNNKDVEITGQFGDFFWWCHRIIMDIGWSISLFLSIESATKAIKSSKRRDEAKREITFTTTI